MEEQNTGQAGAGDDRPAATSKTMEIVVAAVLGTIGAVVMWDSYRLGAGWGDDGPQSGYFPFYVGLLIVICCAVNLFQAFTMKQEENSAFVTRTQLSMVWSVLWPTCVYVVLISGIEFPFTEASIPGLGIYVASVIFIAWFMRRLGHYSWLKIALVSIGVTVFFFLMFEIWFKVPLPKGPLEAALGFA